MVQNLLLAFIVLLCILLIISIFKNPFDVIENACKFKILSPTYKRENNKNIAIFDITIERQHRYFINFPLYFNFYSLKEFKTKVKISYKIPNEEEKQILLDEIINFKFKPKDYTVYITDVIMGIITIEIEIEIEIEPEYGTPTIEFQILKNSTCNLRKEHKLIINFL